MTRQHLIDEMVAEALKEDNREGGKFTIEGFIDYFPEHRSMAAAHAMKWSDDIWDDAYTAYLAEHINNARYD